MAYKLEALGLLERVDRNRDWRRGTGGEARLLPGSTNFQLVFWAGFAGFVLLVLFDISCEMPALHDAHRYAWLVGGLAAIAAGLWVFNRHDAKSAILYFEEIPDEVLTTLHLLMPPPQQSPHINDRLVPGGYAAGKASTLGE